jgi:hypothetical protein
MENSYVDPDNKNKCYLCYNETPCKYSSESNKKSLRGTTDVIRIRLFCCEECVVEFNQFCKCRSCNCELEEIDNEFNCEDCIEEKKKVICSSKM